MFSVNSRSALNAYRSVGIETIVESASPIKLVLMLFDGARAAVSAAIAHLHGNNIPAKCEAISKAISIIDAGLKASLDLSVGGALAQNLSDLYTYMTQRLLYANLKNDAAALAEIAKLLEQLGSAWESLATTQAAAATTSAAAARPRAAAASYGIL